MKVIITGATGMVGSLSELGNAMINAVKYLPNVKVLEVKDIRELSLHS